MTYWTWIRSAGCFLLALVLCGQGHADFVVVGYDSTNPNGANGPASPNLNPAEAFGPVSPLLLSRGLGLIPNQGIAFNSRNWSTAATVNLASNQYLEWGWSSSLQPLDLTNMTLQYDRSASGPSQLMIAIAIDGGVLQSVFSDSSVLISDETHTIDLSSFRGVRSATFRLFGFAASDAGGTLDIEQFQTAPSRGIEVRANLSAVPEPSSYFLGLMIVMVWVVRRSPAFLPRHAGVPAA